MTFTALEIAAAILYLDGGEMHYNKIAKEVLKAGLSGLGKLGGDDPDQIGKTVNRDLKKPYKGELIIDSGSEAGRYWLSDPEEMREYKEIWIAVQVIRRQRLESRIEKHIKKLTSRVDKLINVHGFNYLILEKNNSALEGILKSIEQACSK